MNAHYTAPETKNETLPLLLASFADTSKVRTDYPLVLFEAPSEQWASSLDELLEQLVSDQLSADRQEIVRDNLVRYERAVRLVCQAPAPGPAHEVLTLAIDTLRAELALAPGPDQGLADGLRAVVAAIPPTATLLSYSQEAFWWLFLHATRRRLADRRQEMKRQVRQLRDQLVDFVAVERSHSEAALQPAAFSKALGGWGGELFKPEALSNAVRTAPGGAPFSEERLRRGQTALAALESALAASGPAMVIVDGGGLPPGWTGGGACEVVASDQPYAEAVDRFREQGQRAAETFRAMRTARLLLAGGYVPERHDALVEAFDWPDFTKAELLSLPRVVIADASTRLDAARIGTLLETLRSDLPMQVVIDTQASRNDAHEPLEGGRLEVGMLALALGNLFVQQCTPARFAQLLLGFGRALELPRPGLHVMCTGYFPDRRTSPLGAWMTANAAVEGRAHPLFQIDPDAGTSWAHRLDARHNPMPEQTWPVYPVRDGESELAFTFADFALLDPALAAHFRPLQDDGGERGDRRRALPVAEWCDLPQEQLVEHVPVVRGSIGNQPVELVISYQLAEACLVRARSWRALSELAGFRNEFAQAAAARARSEAEGEARAVQEAIEARHAEELERIRGQAEDEALGRLAQALLGGSADLLPPAPSTRPPELRQGRSAAPEPSSQGAPAEALAAPEDEGDGGMEAYIDTFLCTSCNDCINLNPLLFVYDANKQARIGDLTSGTYRELVEAAEKCPARCIHPGLPTNRDESDLDELIERATSHNR